MKPHDLEKYAKVYMDAWGTQSGIDLTERMLSEPEDSWPTAIVTGSDPMAIGVYNALATRGFLSRTIFRSSASTTSRWPDS